MKVNKAKESFYIDFETSDPKDPYKLKIEIADIFSHTESMKEMLESLQDQMVDGSRKSTLPDIEDFDLNSWQDFGMNPANPANMLKQVKPWRNKSWSAYDGKEIPFSIKKQEELIFAEIQLLGEEFPDFEDFIYERQERVQNGEKQFSLWLVGFKKPLSYKEGYFPNQKFTYTNISQYTVKGMEELIIQLKENQQPQEVIDFVAQELKLQKRLK